MKVNSLDELASFSTSRKHVQFIKVIFVLTYNNITNNWSNQRSKSKLLLYFIKVMKKEQGIILTIT